MNTSLKNICSFVIPVRIDCDERMRNLRTVVDWLAPLNAEIHLLEADKEQKVLPTEFTNSQIHFIKDEKEIFHRTHYINDLLRLTQTSFVAVWDADIIIDREQIIEAVFNFLLKEKYTLICPYNSKCANLDKQLSNKFSTDNDINYLQKKKLQSYIGRPLCGGAYIVNKSFYNSIGGENENFLGWGPEDAERIRRAQIMGHKVGWVSGGCAYHLYHPRNENSRFFSEDTAISTRREFVKVCSMSKEELSEYIKTMPR